MSRPSDCESHLQALCRVSCRGKADLFLSGLGSTNSPQFGLDVTGSGGYGCTENKRVGLYDYPLLKTLGSLTEVGFRPGGIGVDYMRNADVPQFYFLTPKLLHADAVGATGGTISNYLLAQELGALVDLQVISILNSQMPRLARNELRFGISNPVFKSDSRLSHVLERTFFYAPRILHNMRSRGTGPIIATGTAVAPAVSISKRVGVPLAIVVRAYEDFEKIGLRKSDDPLPLSLRLDGWWQKRAILEAYSEANLVITNSHFMADEIKRLMKTDVKTVVLYPVLDLDRVEPSSGPINKIGFINRGGTRKGRDLVELLVERLPDKIFLVYGQPLKLSEPKPNVRNMGYQSNRASLFASADLFIVPSAWDEPFGRVAAEALWSGKPVLVSARGGLSEAAPNPAFWIHSDEVDEWASRVRRIERAADEYRQHVLNTQEVLQHRITASAHRKVVREIVGLLLGCRGTSYAAQRRSS